jgi:hypothetical protein
MPLMRFSSSTLSRKSFLSSKPVNPVSPYLKRYETERVSARLHCWKKMRSAVPLEHVHCFQGDLGGQIVRQRVLRHCERIVRNPAHA